MRLNYQCDNGCNVVITTNKPKFKGFLAFCNECKRYQFFQKIDKQKKRKRVTHN